MFSNSDSPPDSPPPLTYQDMEPEAVPKRTKLSLKIDIEKALPYEEYTRSGEHKLSDKWCFADANLILKVSFFF
jgi:hypothetical protein